MRMSDPTADEVAQAKEDYQRALAVLTAEGLRRKRELVGRCFKYLQQLAHDPAQKWPVYIAVMAVDEEDRLTGWYFQHTAEGEIQVRPDANIQAGFLGQQCVEIERGELITAFNDVLTALARFALRIPAP